MVLMHIQEALVRLSVHWPFYGPVGTFYCLDCSTTVWPDMPDYFISNDALNAPGNPMWFPEFQGLIKRNSLQAIVT